LTPPEAESSQEGKIGMNNTQFGLAFSACGIVAMISDVLGVPLVLIFINRSSLAIGIYGVRVLCFAVLKEARIPLLLTGTAVGLVSFMGFTPDFFMGTLMGYLLDAYPGPTGHHHRFMVLVGISFAVPLATLLFQRFSQRSGA